MDKPFIWQVYVCVCVCVCVCVFIYNLQKEKIRPCLICVHSGQWLGLGWEREGGKDWEEWGERKGGGERRREEGRRSAAQRGRLIGIGLLAHWWWEQKVSSSSLRGGHLHPLFWGSWLVHLHGALSFSQPSDVFVSLVEHFQPWSHFSSFSWKTMRS